MASPDEQKELKKKSEKEELEFYIKFEQKIQPAIEEFRKSFPNGPYSQPRGPMPLGNYEIPFDEWCSYLVRAPAPTLKQKQYLSQPPLPSAQQKNATQVAPNRQVPVGSDKPSNNTASSNSSKNNIAYLEFLEGLSKQHPYDSSSINKSMEEAEHVSTPKTMKSNTDNPSTSASNKMNKKDPLSNGKANIDAGKREFTRDDAKSVLEKFYETRKRKASITMPTIDDVEFKKRNKGKEVATKRPPKKLPISKNPRVQKAAGYKRNNSKDAIMTDREFTNDDERTLGDPPATNNPINNDLQKLVKQLIVKLKIPPRKQESKSDDNHPAASHHENSWSSQQKHSKGIKSQIVEVSSDVPDSGNKGVKPLENGSTKGTKTTKVRDYQDISRNGKRKLVKSTSESSSQQTDILEFDETFKPQNVGQSTIEQRTLGVQSPVITVQTVGNQTDNSSYTRSIEVQTDPIDIQKDSIGTQNQEPGNDEDRADMARFHHALFERKSAIGREYKHRAEKDTEKRSPLEKVSDYLESFLRYTEAVFHQHEADKNGYSYNFKYLNLEKLFDFIRATIEKQGNETPLAGLVKFVKAVILFKHWQLEQNRFRQVENNLLDTYIKDSSSSNSKKAFEEYLNCLESMKKQMAKIHQTFEESKSQLGKRDLKINTDLKATLAFAQEMTFGSLSGIVATTDSTGLGTYSGRYVRYGVREHAMAAAMNGEDGPTHQPIETVAGLPNLLFLRPADVNEHPSVLALSRHNFPNLEGTGTEVSIAANLLEKEGIKVRVVSLPCFELFEKQSLEYRLPVFPDDEISEEIPHNTAAQKRIIELIQNAYKELNEIKKMIVNTELKA
ncbi:27500_t:CDS:10 [Dentiscutata erythropus]|uniref:27500_t:CDS:1 n=1 Tax=Dentiscutata erythropus TaxID=1348616 RepID=A0A9N9A3Q7_9GLOM|nr:27500_t:CDS:10 [Dentiscutata erythropus]